MNKNFIAKHWYAYIYEKFENQTNDVEYAYIYEKFENQTNDVEFLLDILRKHTDGSPQKILEVACGTGRICIPLAEAGHIVTGFDANEHMLLRCYRKMKGMSNINCYLADALTSDWGSEFDVIVLAGNVLINIETEMDYKMAQKTLIHKAAMALKHGGYLFLDFDLLYDPANFFNRLEESSYFKGTDDLGTSGRTVSYGSVYNPVTQICSGVNHWELQANNSDTIIISEIWYKHIPTQAQVYGWLNEAGLTIEKSFKNYTSDSVPEPIDELTHRVSIWARKA